MKTESQVQRFDAQTHRHEPDPNELRNLTLDEMSEVGGGIFRDAPIANASRRIN
jgi:hypothetical protein